MPAIRKQLASGLLAVDTLFQVYVIPSAANTTVSRLKFTNVTGGDVLGSVYHNSGGGDLLLQSKSCPAGSGKVLNIDLSGDTYPEGALIKIQAGTASAVNFILSGIVVT